MVKGQNIKLEVTKKKERPFQGVALFLSGHEN
jgi:hypothetical protein